ncbi:helicase associated domain-containing protein [Streptomyces sp. CBMA156]|uniref:helicase associated domain-containing protein n=1 Tax=Streptomyces sp. CBMA156 TaxID=1930280 RepID=UPI001661E9A0|nr:helicase associated domain-containing protein [Streptomyces sp. CBMA156]MBD0673616.1 hypothetical protein [Streptomyces sp. CBMA156]
MVGRITELRAQRSQGTAHTTAAQSAEGEQQPALVESPVEWLKINARRHAALILQTVKLRAFNPRAVVWQRMHAVAAVFHLRHGHLAIPATAKLDDYAVGAWMRRRLTNPFPAVPAHPGRDGLTSRRRRMTTPAIQSLRVSWYAQWECGDALDAHATEILATAAEAPPSVAGARPWRPQVRAGPGGADCCGRAACGAGQRGWSGPGAL